MDFNQFPFNFSDESLTDDRLKFLNEMYLKQKYNIPAVVMVSVCAQAFIAFVGLIANFVIIVVTCVGSNRQESSSITYVMNLSISNFVFLVTVPFKLAEVIRLEWLLGNFCCQLVTLITYLNFTVVALFLMVMSIDRYLAVNRAISASHLRSKCASKVACLFVWLLAFAGALPLALLHSAEEGMRCTPKFPGHTEFNISFVYLNNTEPSGDAVKEIRPECKYPSEATTFTIWTLCNFFYSFFLPFMVIIGCYCAVVQRIRHPAGMVNSKGRLQRVVRRKVTQMAVMLVISYTVCYAPYHVWQAAKLVGIPVQRISTCFHIERFNTTMAYINSALHPIVYALTSGQYEKQYRQAKRRIGLIRVSNRYLTSQTKKTSLQSTKGRSPREKSATAQLLTGSKVTSNQSLEASSPRL